MIMVEALVHQLAAARAHGCSSAGPAPSELREKLVQTEHTELKQVQTHSVKCGRSETLSMIMCLILFYKSHNFCLN